MGSNFAELLANSLFQADDFYSPVLTDVQQVTPVKIFLGNGCRAGFQILIFGNDNGPAFCRP